MNSSMAEMNALSATNVSITDDTLAVDLSDGRTILVPIAWYPRLLHGSPNERSSWRLIGGGRGIHWPVLDEDISVVNLLVGQRSAEAPASFKRWLTERREPGGGKSRKTKSRR